MAASSLYQPPFPFYRSLSLSLSLSPGHAPGSSSSSAKPLFLPIQPHKGPPESHKGPPTTAQKLRILVQFNPIEFWNLKTTMASESSWVGRKPVKRIGGMSDALSIAADLGFSVSPSSSQEGLQTSSPATGEKGEDLIKVLRELTTVQRKIADLQVELQGRKDDKNVAHLTHVSEMEKKIETLARITTILKDVIQNKDRIISRLQQPYSLDCIPVEAEYQKQFSELLMKAASDYGALTASVADFQWSQNFKEPPSVWGEMLRPIPVALASCTRFFEAMSATRESFAALQKLRVGNFDSSVPSTPARDPSQRLPGVSDCLTSPP